MKIATSPGLLNLSMVGDGYAVLESPSQLVAAYRVSGGANPWVEEQSSILSKLAQFEKALIQLRPGEQIQILVRRVPTDPEVYINHFKSRIKDTAPLEFRTRYADYFQDWMRDMIAQGNLGHYESYLFFTALETGSGALGTLSENSKKGCINAEAVLARARSWAQNLTGIGLKVEPLQAGEYARLIGEEFNLEPSHGSTNAFVKSALHSVEDGGFTTLKERIAAVPAFFRKDHFEVGRFFGKTIYLSDIPESSSDSMFFSKLFNQRETFKISLFFRGVDQASARSRIETQMKGDLGTLQKGNLINVDAQAQLQARQAIMEAVARGETKLLYQSAYITVLTENFPYLKELSENFAAHMENIHQYAGYYEQKSLFLSTLPLGHNKARREFLMTSKDGANCWPFFQDDLTQDVGVPLGFSVLGDVVAVDPWADYLENWNAVVIGKAGSGKSFSIQQQVIRHIPFDPYVMVIDKSQSYKFLCDAAGGEYVYIDLSGDVHLNVFDIETGPGYEGEVPVEKTSDLLGFLNVLLAEENEKRLPNLAQAHMEEAIRLTYAEKFRSDPNNPIPTLSDLRKVLSGMSKDKDRPEDFRSLCRRYDKILEPFTGHGTYANLTDRPTAFKTDSNFIVFDTSRLPEAGNILSLGVYIISQFCVKKAIENKAKGRRSWLLLDETWFLARFPAGVEFLLNLAKRSRHMALASIFATQQISDFLKNPDVRPVVDNATTKFIFQPGSSEIPVLEEALKLTPIETQTVGNLHQVRGAYSQCYAIIGTRARGVIYVSPDPVSYVLATTHPLETRERGIFIESRINKAILEKFGKDEPERKDYLLEQTWSGVFQMVAEKLNGRKP